MDPILSRTILILIVIVGGCSKGTKPLPIKPAPVTTTLPAFYSLNIAEQKNEYLAIIKTLNKGDKIDDVVKKVGGLNGFTAEPYEIYEIEETYGTEVKCSTSSFSGGNLYFSFWFGKDDRLIKISTYQGLSSFKKTEIQMEGIDLQ